METDTEYLNAAFAGTGSKRVVVQMLKDYYIPNHYHQCLEPTYKNGAFVTMLRGAAKVLVNSGYARFLATEAVR